MIKQTLQSSNLQWLSALYIVIFFVEIKDILTFFWLRQPGSCLFKNGSLNVFQIPRKNLLSYITDSYFFRPLEPHRLLRKPKFTRK